jgi:peroxiredoxin Q/BCP
MAKLNKGDKAPDFTLTDQNGREVSLQDYRGRKVLLYFYPRAGTSGCTLQAESVRDAKPELVHANVVPIGISPDARETQKKFDRQYHLDFPLLSDKEHKAADVYGVWGEKNMAGRKSMGVIRSSFLIDEEGRVMGAWYKVKPDQTVPNAEEELKRNPAGR